MPIYEFRCRKCRKEFEARRLFSEADKPAPCPACGGPGEKLISGFGFKMGFYTRPSDKPLRDAASTWSGGAAESAKGSETRKAKAAGPRKAPKARTPAAKAKRGK